MAHVITFDTLAYANKLKAAGFEINQAETLAHAQADLLSSLAVDQLATKQDVRHLENKIKSLEGRVDSIENRIIIKMSSIMGGMMVIAVSILATLITIMH